MVAEKNPYLNTKRICRVRWNYYHINSMTSFHIDSSNPNYTSIIYNLQSMRCNQLMIAKEGYAKPNFKGIDSILQYKGLIKDKK